MTGILGAFVEAWEELKIHKMRVMLSLVGVAVSVAAMTGVMAIGQMMEEIQAQMMEQYTGRPATITTDMWPLDDTGETTTADQLAVPQAMGDFVERYEIQFASRVSSAMLPIQQGPYLVDVWATVVDQPYAEIRRLNVSAGHWFSPQDADRLSPPMVVNEAFMNAMDLGPFTGPVAIPIYGDTPTTGTIIGVVPDAWEWEEPTAYILFDSYLQWVVNAESAQAESLQPQLVIWIDPLVAEEAMARLSTELASVEGTRYEVSSYREDYSETDDYLATFRLVVIGVGVLIMGLAALNLVNIAMVTMRQRVREIGIRRSFGASSARVFFSVMLESVVATVLAGAIGVTIAVVALRYIQLEWIFGEIPAGIVATFPVEAAVIGMVAATAVGAISGLIPALTAVRIRPIDAIRY